MRFAYYIKKLGLRDDSRVEKLLCQLRAAGSELYSVESYEDFLPDTDALLSLGGDGTFLSAAALAVRKDIPVLGVNFGRLGFLSDVQADDLAAAVLKAEFFVEERSLLKFSGNVGELDGIWPCALNEISVSRVSASMLGVDLSIDGTALPTYWADGLLVATSSGSTAYSLSVGGPICLPESKVFIVAPISPHNLNVRPLIVPETSSLKISLRSRDEHVVFSIDNRTYTIPAGASIDICVAPVKLKRMCFSRPTFINALRSRLLWGEDVRNEQDY